MKLGLAEILGKVSNGSTPKDRVNLLREYGSPALAALLSLAYDPRIVWLLPKGEAPYKPNKLVDQEGVLYSELRKMYLFIEGGHDTIKQPKREFLFVELLENLAPADAELMVAVKDKKLPFKNITPKIVREAFPGLLPDEEK
jgi:hypothetical protein